MMRERIVEVEQSSHAYGVLLARLQETLTQAKRVQCVVNTESITVTPIMMECCKVFSELEDALFEKGIVAVADDEDSYA